MRRFFLKKHKIDTQASARLEEMARVCRDAEAEATLSAEARSRILSEALRPAEAAEPLPALFTPGRRLILAGALPVLLAVALLAGTHRGVRAPVPAAEGSPRVAVLKHGDQILFCIRNGEGQHSVYRSTDPGRFDPADRLPVAEGSHVDGLNDNADLVFYRID